ncbi:hypothetical protein WDU94_003218 [Cyamophila willieti]
MMDDELPILKSILKGNARYHNAPVRFGRVPKREKARILAAMQQSTNTKCTEKALAQELDDDQRLLSTVVRAHLDTCAFTVDKVEPMLRRAREHPTYTACPSTLACPLNPNPVPLQGQQELLQDFSERFSPTIRGVVEFAKRIPGFSLLSHEDQVTLLKAGVFEVLLVRLACMFDSQTNSMICLNGEVLCRDSIHSSNARFLMDSMFEFAERLNGLHLSDTEIGLFSSIVVISPTRRGLRNKEIVERMRGRLENILMQVLHQNHPDQMNLCAELIAMLPDLSTLNQLHSEKLVAFQMTEQQQALAAQQQQQQQWHGEDNSKSPTGSSWSDVTMEEVKSPLGSVSSTESVCSNEVATLNEYTSSHAQSAPLLAATLAGAQCPHRNRANSGSTTDGDRMSRFRKLDSPTDSGIESGTEKIEKHASAPTSVCSSPRSSFEEKDFNHVEDMPVLKRILQAPPLDTSSLMDEAYKPHKKFRALRQKDSAEAEPLHPSLASSHSMLAKSLMEGPRMTPDQLKRTEIVHNYIMRTDSPPSAYFPRSWHSSSVIKPAPPATVTSNALLELQVAATSQPLNLSKKTPPPSPRLSVQVSLEA